jgi:hypothetical protein
MISDRLREAPRIDGTEMGALPYDQGEFVHILGRVFGKSAQVGEREIACGDDPAQFALKLTYWGDGQLADIMEGPNLDSRALEQIAASINSWILASAGDRIGTAILFSDSLCQKPKKRPTRLFREFVDYFPPGPAEFEKRRKQLYINMLGPFTWWVSAISRP